MKRFTVLLYILSVGFLGQGWSANREPSYPLITGDGFRAACQWIYDETQSFEPKRVSPRDAIFVKTDYLEAFARDIHPFIVVPYVLVSHNSDHPAPGPCAHLLNDDKLIAWFAQNVENIQHPKLFPIPIGIENRYNCNGNPDIIMRLSAHFKSMPKTHLLYLNIAIATYPLERQKVYDIFHNAPYCCAPSLKSYEGFLGDLATSYFVLSPRGNGWDCHRTWQALYMGSIPIVKRSASDALFEELPVILVNDWEEINETFLMQKWEEFSSRTFREEKLFMSYWIERIREKQGR